MSAGWTAAVCGRPRAIRIRSEKRAQGEWNTLLERRRLEFKIMAVACKSHWFSGCFSQLNLLDLANDKKIDHKHTGRQLMCVSHNRAAATHTRAHTGRGRRAHKRCHRSATPECWSAAARYLLKQGAAAATIRLTPEDDGAGDDDGKQRQREERTDFSGDRWSAQIKT